MNQRINLFECESEYIFLGPRTPKNRKHAPPPLIIDDWFAISNVSIVVDSSISSERGCGINCRAMAGGGLLSAGHQARKKELISSYWHVRKHWSKKKCRPRQLQTNRQELRHGAPSESKKELNLVTKNADRPQKTVTPSKKIPGALRAPGDI